ncbi:MAG: hypothetical protein NTV22_13745 [bacterium]|nr:hypothetical protein [bacterium]
MNKILTLTVAVVCSALISAAASFTAGNLAVLRIGDGVNPLVNSNGAVSILEVAPAGGVVQTIAIDSSTNGNGINISGNATSEGQLVADTSKTALSFGGYWILGGSGSLSGRSSANAPRVWGKVANDGTYTAGGTATFYNVGTTKNIRAVALNGADAYGAFSGSLNLGTIQITNVNSRGLLIHGGNLYYSTGSGAVGTYAYVGFPTVPTAAAQMIINPSTGFDPYDFAISPGTLANGSSIYIANGTISLVQRWNFDGATWTLANTFTNTEAVYGIAVDFGAPQPIVYAAAPNALYMVVDAGSNATMTSILSAGANYVFRGLDWAPVPEPAALGLLAAALVLARRSRR